MPDSSEEGFDVFFAAAEPRLRRALVATYGIERGREAAAEAFAFAWQHWGRVAEMDNPVGYLYRVGQSRTRPRRQPVLFPPVPHRDNLAVEPGLPAALEQLSERERVTVVLIEAFGWTPTEVAATTGLSLSSVRSYLRRGLDKLRSELGVSEDA